MAITNARMQMRRGLEADFDPDKMQPGEWAVSLDKKYVRMCFSVGVCVRMATYDAFEEDMAQIEEILSKCETIEEAVAKINTEVSANAKAVAEYTEQAKKYRDEAKAFRDEAESIAGIGVATKDKAGIVKPDGETIRVDADGTIHADNGTVDYNELENKPKINDVELSGSKSLSDLGIASADDLEETNSKVNIIIEKAELNIKNNASGENLHLTDSANGKNVAFGLHGKAEQTQYSGKNLLPNTATSTTKNGVTFTVNDDGSVSISGIETSGTSNPGIILTNTLILPAGKYIISHNYAGSYNTVWMYVRNKDTNANIVDIVSAEKTVVLAEDVTVQINIYAKAGATISNATLYPMIRLATIEDSTYEPYVGGIPSPNPDYPQEIEVAGSDGSVEVVSCGKNLLKNTAVSQTVNGVTFTVNEDGSVTANGTATANASFAYNPSAYIGRGKTIIMSGCPSGGNSTNAYLLRLARANTTEYVTQDTGNNGIGAIYTTEEDYYGVRIIVYKGYTTNNLVFKPMIRLASDTDDTFEPYEETLSTIPTPDGLAGIPVESGGNYTDENGQQWIADEIVKYADGSGKRVQRIGKVVFNGSDDEKWTLNEMNDNTARYVIENIVSIKNETNAICNLLPFISGNNGAIGPVDYYCFAFRNELNGFTFRLPSSIQTVAQLRTYLNEKNLIVYYVLAEPIITDLTAEEIAEIEKLHTFYPITNISNYADCGMSITYLCDSKRYIDNKIAELANALLEATI